MAIASNPEHKELISSHNLRNTLILNFSLKSTIPVTRLCPFPGQQTHKKDERQRTPDVHNYWGFASQRLVPTSEASALLALQAAEVSTTRTWEPRKI